MVYKSYEFSQFVKYCAAASILSVLLVSGCAVEAAKTPDTAKKDPAKPAMVTVQPDLRAKIQILPDSPADTVRVFYQKMREKKFRDALFLTNLRPAIEGLTEAELQDLKVDFDVLAGQIPAEIAINGEIITTEQATVTAKLPDNDTGELKLQEIKLRRENGVWIILTVDDSVEKLIRKEGKNYFFALKNETHQEEAKAMLERVFKAQLVHSAQNAGAYGDIAALVANEFLPADINTPDSTGYNFTIDLSSDKKSYRASAVPAVYGKTGKLSFLLSVDSNRKSSIKSADNQGKPVKNR